MKVSLRQFAPYEAYFFILEKSAFRNVLSCCTFSSLSRNVPFMMYLGKFHFAKFFSLEIGFLSPE